MRSTDERMDEVLGRARAREAATRRRHRRAAVTVGGALSIVTVVAVGIGLSSVSLSGSHVPSGPLGLMGSVFSDNPALGYVAVGLLGLVLGVAITVMAYRLGRKPGSKRSPMPQAPEDTRADGESAEP